MRLVPNAGEIRAAIQSYLLLLGEDRGFIDPKISDGRIRSCTRELEDHWPPPHRGGMLPHQQILLKVNTISLKLAGECNGPQNTYSYFKRKIRPGRLFSLGFKKLDRPPFAFLVVQSCVVITLPMQGYIFFFVTSILPASRLLKWTS